MGSTAVFPGSQTALPGYQVGDIVLAADPLELGAIGWVAVPGHGEFVNFRKWGGLLTRSYVGFDE